MIRTLPVDGDRLALISTGHVEAVMPWIEKDGRRVPGTEQERDETSGLPLWTCHALAIGGDRPELVAVRLPAREQPQVDAHSPLRFERLEVRVNVNRSTGQLAGYWAAAGIAGVADSARRPKQEQPAA